MIGCRMWIPAFVKMFFATIELATCRDDVATITAVIIIESNVIRTGCGITIVDCNVIPDGMLLATREA